MLTVPFAMEIPTSLFPLLRRTMEVFHMNIYERYQINDAIKAYNGSKTAYRKMPPPKRKRKGQWDSIIRIICIGCGRTLGRYENLHRFAYCFTCRKVLYPETVYSVKTAQSRPLSSHSRGHSL